MSDYINKRNIRLLNDMKEKGEIAYGLVKGNMPVTLNDLIKFCKDREIDFDNPILLECPGGYFPLAYIHEGTAMDENEKEYTLGCMVITDGEW